MKTKLLAYPIAIFLLFTACSKEPSYQVTDGEVVTLQEASEGNGIDLVIMGDGYTAKLIHSGVYEEAMRTTFDKFFSEEPFTSFKKLFNVYYVVGVSGSEGIGEGKSTCFGVKHESLYSSRFTGNSDFVKRYAKRAIGEERTLHSVMIVVVNNGEHGGTTHYLDRFEDKDWGDGSAVIYVPYMGGGDQFRNVILHEAGGHGLAKLGDEYYQSNTSISTSYRNAYDKYAPMGWYRNVDITSRSDEVKWKHFIDDERYSKEKIAVYMGGLTFQNGVYRPTADSIMGKCETNKHFNAPSREAIYITIHKKAYGDEWTYDFEDFAAWDAINR